MSEEKLKSGITGMAKVVFGGGIGVKFGNRKDGGINVGLTELVHPCAKAGDPITDEKTRNGKHVLLVFPDFDTLSNFRHILDDLEAKMRNRMIQKQED